MLRVNTALEWLEFLQLLSMISYLSAGCPQIFVGLKIEFDALEKQTWQIDEPFHIEIRKQTMMQYDAVSWSST